MVRHTDLIIDVIEKEYWEKNSNLMLKPIKKYSYIPPARYSVQKRNKENKRK